MSVFVHAQGIKTVHAGRGGQKMAKKIPHSCWMPPLGIWIHCDFRKSSYKYIKGRWIFAIVENVDHTKCA